MQRLAILVILVLPLLTLPARAQTDEGWLITSFDVAYVIRDDGVVEVVEDIRVDLGDEPGHGILRDLRVETAYNADYTREYTVRVLSVDNGSQPVPFQTSRDGAVLTLRIGDPDRLVSGPQRYRISYVIEDGLNPQEAWDELFWNVTGNEWAVEIASASATVTAPSIERVECFQGPTGSREPCQSQTSANTATFRITTGLPPYGGLTIAVGLTKGSVTVPPPKLIEIKTWQEQVRDFLGIKPLPILAAIIVGSGGLLGVLRYWWLQGRDRWLGDVQYLTENEVETRRPLFAKDTVIVEYAPPEIGKENKRGLRPAELGTLIDERADTLDVTATIVDLAVRGYLKITEIPKQGLFGKTDYQLDRLKEPDASLLPYESRLLTGLFEDGASVKMSDLKNEFYTDLAEVKKLLYTQVTESNHFFARNPEDTRTYHYIGAVLLIGAGIAAGYFLGQLIGAAIIGGAIAIAGLLLLILAGAMPRRTGRGREMYRRTLGFRKFMTVAETDRQRFNEEIGLFEKYLPYAIVFECVERWAKAFEGLDAQQAAGNQYSWYTGTTPFTAAALSSNLQSFSSSISSSISSTPGGSGGSGFSGGGFSGGGGGGGGGGRW